MGKKSEQINFVCEQEVVIQAEREYLSLKEGDTGMGLAISGGGIRSASFGMGVMQALANNCILSKVDFMSTVSGGGYLGSALTWALKQGGTEAGTQPENFPLGRKGVYRVETKKVSALNRNKSDNDLLDFIRLHGSYLTPNSSLDIVSLIAVVARSMVMSLFVYLSILTVVMTLAVWSVYFLAHYFLPEFFNSANVNFTRGVMLIVGLIFFGVITSLGFLFSLSTFLSSKKFSMKRYLRFVSGQKFVGLMLKISIACFVFGSLPYFLLLLEDTLSKLVVPGASTLFGTLVGLWQYKKAKNKEANNSMKSSLLIYSGAIALFYGIILFAYIASTNYFLNLDTLTMAQPEMFGGLVLLTLFFGTFVNLNYIGPHYLWRNRLMEAFMPNKKAVGTKSWQPSVEADSALMEDMCDELHPRPYHIINTNVILANSPKVVYSGRGGDNFIVSRLYCGSEATGWKPTKDFQKNATRGGITLATAMATSAAALNPNAGVSGEGVTRNTVISLLLSMLNLRLGYWTSNPSMENAMGSPNFFKPGLTSELLRFGLTETNRNIQLSDGGHYENLAIYELIRRKVKTIIVSDGGADAAFNFDDLANAIEKVRVDFGVKIKFIDKYGAADILPGTLNGNDFDKKYSIATKGFAIADIIYNHDKPEENGKLVYLKLAMIESLPTDVYSYKGIYPDFPHQSTADQFFDEKQFEAYRELGYYICKQMLASEAGMEIFDLVPASSKPSVDLYSNQ